jgi:RimJ/RimL family protein N-acetyltransferase
MVRRGSPVRVRKRALKSPDIGDFCCLNWYNGAPPWRTAARRDATLREHARTLAQATPWNLPGNDTLRIAQMNVSLRPLEDRDLDTIYQQVTDPESVRMAAFTAEDQTDRRAFLNRMSRLRTDTSVSYRVIDVDGAIAGAIGSFRIDDQLEVTYWVDRAQWGKGIASAALQILLAETAERPLYARAASDNVGSLRVLEKAGFRRVGVNRDFAPGRGQEIEETILRLD